MNPINKENIRRIQRFSLALPIRVESGLSEDYSWKEITRLNDVSAFGAGFNLRHSVKRGRLLQMTIPLPRQMRCYDFTEPQYKVWGLVRSCVPKEDSANEENHAVGVAFIGKRPPKSYYDDPAKLFEISHQEDGELWNIVDAQDQTEEEIVIKDLRRHSRFSIPANVIIEKIDAEGNFTPSHRVY